MWNENEFNFVLIFGDGIKCVYGNDITHLIEWAENSEIRATVADNKNGNILYENKTQRVINANYKGRL